MPNTYLTREAMPLIFLSKQLAVQIHIYGLWQLVGLDVMKIYNIYLSVFIYGEHVKK
jgi:hypothetical protein